MEVTRGSLRAQRNQKAPKQVSQRQTRETGGYGDELKQQLQNIGDVKREAPVIQAKKIEQIVSPTEQYTQDAVKTAMEKLKKFVVSQGLGGDTSGTPATTTPFTSTAGGGGGALESRDFFTGLTNDQLGLLSTQELVDRDNEMYGDTFPEGSFSPTDTGAMVNRDKMLYGDTFPKGSFNITPKSLGEKQSEKTYEQNRLKEGEKFADRGEREAINASGFQQANVRGSAFNTGKDESKRPKTVTIDGQTVAARQTVASLPSNYKQTEAQAFAKTAAFKEAQKIAAKNPNVKVGVDSKGQPKATAVQKSRTEAKATTAKANAARVKSNAKAKAQAAAVNRKMSGTKPKTAKERAQDAAKARKAAGPNRKMSAGQVTRSQAGASARTAQGNRARVKANARKRAQAAARKRRAKKKGKKGKK